ncbi:MAG TPA: glycosyltransferase [Pseudoxanthomonas sp.]|nr:glycosyltransferase [Pseudoxanthomonas sp.]
MLIDLQGGQTSSRFRGIGRYSVSLAQAMARQAGEHEIWLCLNANLDEGLQEIHSAFAGVLPSSRIVNFAVSSDVKWSRPGNAWRRSTAELTREAFIAALQPDIVHVSSLFEGAEEDAVVSIGRFAPQPATAVTLYDLIPLLNPDAYLGADWARCWYMERIASLRRAQLMLAISTHAKCEAEEALGDDRGRIVNISSAVSEMFRPLDMSESELHELQTRHRINRPFVMYSGALDSRKNIGGLLEAFSLLPADLRKAHQLVIAGRSVPEERVQVLHLARRHGLHDDEFVLTGYVSNVDLVALYNACAVFTLPSLHEGFGLPALEAMACGAATIGSSTSSIPEVIGRSDALFEPTRPAEMAGLITRVLAEPAYRTSLREHASVQAKKFSWKTSARCALDAFQEIHERNDVSRRIALRVMGSRDRGCTELVQAVTVATEHGIEPSTPDLEEAARCIDRNRTILNQICASQLLPSQLKWRVEGPFDSSYSLALLNRETALALKQRGHDVALHSTEGLGDFLPNQVYLDARLSLKALHERSMQVSQLETDVSSRNLYPPRVADMRSGLNLLHHYAWEESGFPADWVADFNWHLNGITCLSKHVEKVLIDNGVEVPLTVSGCGVDHWERVIADATYPVQAKRFRFLHVSSCFPRKGVDVLLRAYGRAFRLEDDVSLMIKTFANPHNRVHEWLAEARANQPDYPDVVIIEADLDDSQLKSLYQQCQVLVAPSRAEGFGLPMAEAMLSGAAVITTAWGGQLDFCNETTAWLIDFDFAPADTHFRLYDSVWAEPNVDALARALRELHGLPELERRRKSEAGRVRLLKDFKWDDVAARLEESARSFAGCAAAPVGRVGMVTTWNTRCGVATYAEHLCTYLSPKPLVLAMETDVLVCSDGQEVRRCWHAGADEALARLEKQIVEDSIESLVIQFQYSFFQFAPFAEFLCRQVQLGRTVVVMMHATVDPPHVPEKKLALLVEALGNCARVLVHSVTDLNRLKRLGLVENVALFPHGLLDFQVPDRAESVGSFIISSYGFFLPHKGLLQLIEATAQLVAEGRDVRLEMINAEYPVPESGALIKEARAAIASLGMGERVTLTTDFLPDHESLAMLGQADLIVFPYQATGESASGAVRYGLATGRPVAVTPLPIFADVRPAVFELPGHTSGDIAAGIARIMDEGAPLEEARRWREAHRYSKLGQRLQAILGQLVRRHASKRLSP